MIRKVLGSTGIRISQVGMGGAFVTSRQGPFEQAKSAVGRAVELGMNYVDTAPSYGDSEEVLGRILAEVDAPLVLSTKLGGRPEPFDPQDRGCLMRSVENSLRIFSRDCIDLLFVHEPERPRQYDWWSAPERFDGPVMELLADLKAEGTIRATGVGGTTAYEMAHIIRTGRFDVVLTAFNYSLLWREAEREVLPAAVEQGMGIVIGSPLQQGALAQRYDHEVENGVRWLSPPRREQYQALYAFLDEIELSITEAAHRFVISNPDISCMLTGARSAEEVEGNVAEVEKGPLPEEVLARLDEIAAMVPFRPFCEPFGLPFGREYKGPGQAGG